MNAQRYILILLAAMLLVACGGPAATAPTPPPATFEPTVAPTVAPTAVPTAVPTALSTATPLPTAAPTAAPTVVPTATPLALPPDSQALARGSFQSLPYIVMLDNHPNAYPQIGMNGAAVVFEALAEFGLTRFMAIYAPGVTPPQDTIGPVRSARLYFVQWAMGFGGMYVHAGGSPQALETLQSTGALVNLDALFQASSIYFSRTNDRDAPHNLMTGSAALQKALQALSGNPAPRPDAGFLFKDDAPEAQRPDAQQIGYFFLYREDSVGWVYERSSNSYLRLRRGVPARDAVTGEQLRTRNLVVIEVQEGLIPGDDKGRIEQIVIGSGKARLFQDGVAREVAWRKDADIAPLLFLDANGEEVAFNVGLIWITAVPTLENVSVTP